MPRHTFRIIDAHTCGNPVRVVIGNQPELRGGSMSELRQHFIRDYDWVRTGLMFEPRGHEAMSGSILYPPTRKEHDLGVLFIEVSGCLPMCGHGAIGTVTVAIEQNLVTPKTPGRLLLDTPAGPVEARYELVDGHVESVEITNVPGFLHSFGIVVAVPGIGDLVMDVSYGGNFYAIIEPQKNYQGLDHFSVDDIRRFSPLVRDEINRLKMFVHPEDETIRAVSHVMWTDRAKHGQADMRNVVFYGDRGIDRSPCGTGTCARMAQLVARGELAVGQRFVHESIIGSLFTGYAIEPVSIGGYSAIRPAVSGWARVTGHNQIIIDERDPYAHGFLLI